MSARPITRTIWATVVAFALCLPAETCLAAAAPREQPQCCEISLANLPGQFVAGASPQGFSATFHNGGQQKISSLQLTFAFNADGGKISSGQMHLQRRTDSGTWHTVNLGHHDNAFIGTDSISGFGDGLAAGATATWQYQMWFGEKAPNTHFNVAVGASGRAFGNRGRLATSPTYQTFVTIAVPPVAATPTPTPTPPKPTPTQTPTPTPTETPTPAAAQPSNVGTPPAAAPLDAGTTSSQGGGLMWLAYTIGALLLLAGIAAIGTMVWRRGPRAIETEWPDEEYEPAPDPYGAPLPPEHPTAAWPGGTTYGTPGTSFDGPTAPAERLPAQVDPTRQMPR